MNVKEILIEKLKAIGADGLCCDGCGCGIDDLAPCGGGSPITHCVPAQATLATTEEAAHHGCEVGEVIYVGMAETPPDSGIPCPKCAGVYSCTCPTKAQDYRARSSPYRMNERAKYRYFNEVRFKSLCEALIINKFTSDDLILATHIVGEHFRRPNREVEPPPSGGRI